MDSGQNNSFGSPITSGDFDAGQAGGATSPSGMEFQGVVSSGSDDIVIGGVEPKKSKKPMIIALALVGVLAVVAIVLGVVMMSGGGKGGGSVDSLKTAFNKYANYALYGVESTEDIDGDVEAMLDYAFVEGRNDEFSMEKMKELFVEFKELVENSELEDEDLKDTVGYNWGNLLFLELTREVKPYTNDQLLKMLLADGYTVAVNKVDSYYDKYEQSESVRARNYAEAKEKRDKIVLYRYNEYSKNGCIKDGVIDEVCASGVAFGEEYGDEAMKQYAREANSSYASRNLDFAGLVFQARDLINSDGEDEI